MTKAATSEAGTPALNLRAVPAGNRARVQAAFERGDATDLVLFDNQCILHFVWDNWVVLRMAGLYESALMDGIIMPRGNTSHMPLDALRLLLDVADRERLRALGDALPGPGPFTLYRGVAGRGAADTWHIMDPGSGTGMVVRATIQLSGPSGGDGDRPGFDRILVYERAERG